MCRKFKFQAGDRLGATVKDYLYHMVANKLIHLGAS